MDTYSSELLKRARALNGTADLTELIEFLSEKKIVMLGEATHGTSEYYEWRSKISMELIQKHGFQFIAVEGDWPPCQRVNDYLTGKTQKNAVEALLAFDRWPTWMWANREVAEFISELKSYNDHSKRPVSFHGLDVYSLIDSIDETIKLLLKIDPSLATKAKSMYSCLEPYRNDEKEYARSLFQVPEGCEEEVVSLLEELLHYRLKDPEKYPYLFDAIQNATIIKNAERYYRSMVSLDDTSWNIRDRHMMDTLTALLNHHGEDSKCIVWAHNTHIGDYRGTDMVLHGQVNLGGLARESYGSDQVALVGFGSHSGTVIASHAWDGPVQVLPVSPARAQSIECIMHELIDEIGSSDFYFFVNETKNNIPLLEFKPHRAIGVVYHPASDRRGNYVPTSLGIRYDVFIYLDETHAITPFAVGFDPRKLPESYPFGSRI